MSHQEVPASQDDRPGGRLTGLFLYPVKGMAGAALQRCALDERGLQGDRRWMVVDQKGAFLTQRQLPAMARVKVSLQDDALHLETAGCPPLTVRAPRLDAPRVEVSVWGRPTQVQHAPAAHRWLSDLFGRSCHLVYQPQDTLRPLPPPWQRAGTGLADGFPFLLISEASLGLLNQRLGDKGLPPVAMARFRPNLVVSGVAAHAEDTWRTLRIGQVSLRVALPCERCTVTMVDPRTGVRDPQRQPLATLREYRANDQGNPEFGQNLIYAHLPSDADNELRVGDAVLPG